MIDDNLGTLVAHGLRAMKAGIEIAMKANPSIRSDAKHPELQAELTTGDKTLAEWDQRVTHALREALGAEDEGNPIIEALYEVNHKVRSKAPDDRTRDLGTIAAGQLALHYWIASFGTLQAYASEVGLSKIEQSMKTSLEEAKSADQRHVKLARAVLNVA